MKRTDPAKTMRAARVNAFGPLEVIHVETVDRPAPGPGEVLVRVHAAGVGPWDALIRTGKSGLSLPLPLTLGSDFSGTIEQIGSGVTRFKPGDAVFGATNPQFTGAQAEFAVASSAMIAPRPKGWSDEEAASAPVVSVTAWQMLFDYGGLKAGQTVLIHAAAGSVGAYAVQFARHRKIRTIGTAGRQDLDYVRSLGADQVLDYRANRFEGVVPQVDAVLDLVGGEIQERSFSVIKPGGILVSAVSPPNENRLRSYGIRGKFFLVEVTTERLMMISEMIASGELVPSVGEVLPLDQVRAAHEILEGRRKRRRGKIVLKIAE